MGFRQLAASEKRAPYPAGLLVTQKRHRCDEAQIPAFCEQLLRTCNEYLVEIILADAGGLESEIELDESLNVIDVLANLSFGEYVIGRVAQDDVKPGMAPIARQEHVRIGQLPMEGH